MVEHTPGPWIVGYAASGKPYIVADHGKRWNNPTICHLYEDVTPEGSVTIEPWLEAFDNAEANARVVAAAPEMLAILEKYVTVLESDDKEALTKLLQETRDVIEEIKGS
jgi:hypothetical protein